MRVVLRSSPHSAESDMLEFYDGRWNIASAFICTAAVTIGGEHQTVEVWAHEHVARDLVGFFNDMESYQRWPGVMSWEPLEPSIRLEVRNPRGLEATFDISIRQPPEYDVWSGSLAVPADELPRAAEAMRKLTGIAEGRKL